MQKKSYFIFLPLQASKPKNEGLGVVICSFVCDFEREREKWRTERGESWRRKRSTSHESSVLSHGVSMLFKERRKMMTQLVIFLGTIYIFDFLVFSQISINPKNYLYNLVLLLYSKSFHNLSKAGLVGVFREKLGWAMLAVILVD